MIITNDYQNLSENPKIDRIVKKANGNVLFINKEGVIVFSCNEKDSLFVVDHAAGILRVVTNGVEFIFDITEFRQATVYSTATDFVHYTVNFHLCPCEDGDYTCYTSEVFNMLLEYVFFKVCCNPEININTGDECGFHYRYSPSIASVPLGYWAVRTSSSRIYFNKTTNDPRWISKYLDIIDMYQRSIIKLFREDDVNVFVIVEIVFGSKVAVSDVVSYNYIILDGDFSTFTSGVRTCVDFNTGSEPSPGGSGITDVNGNFGPSVTLTAADVGADAAGTAATAAAAAVSSSNAYTDAQVSNAIQGLSWKDEVVVATTANITLSGEQTIDGVLTAASRVLVKDQSTLTQNGIYVSAAGAWTRATDSDTGTKISGAVVEVTQGSTNANTSWRQTSDLVVIGATNIVWTVFGTSTPLASPTTSGTVKLYTSTGTNTDGTMDQNSITNALAAKVAGPASAVDNNVAFYDGVTGKLIKDSGLTLSGVNTGDQVAASVAEINTGTDNAKFATALNLEGSKYVDQSGAKLYAVASGTDTYAATISPAITVYAAGQSFKIIFTNANTTASTIDLNGLGAKNIYKNVNQALVSGDIPAGAILELVYDGTNFQVTGGLPDIILSNNNPEYFGSGSDGNVTISSGTTTLTRDMYYDTLTLSGTGILNTAGYRVFCKTLDLSATTQARSIICVGTNGANTVSGAGGGNGGAGAVGVTVGGTSSQGSVGGTGNSGAGVVGGVPSAVAVSAGGAGGDSGAGGTGPGGAGGASAVGGLLTVTFWVEYILMNTLQRIATAVSGGAGGRGGSSGGGDGVSATGRGGGGGGGGGGIIILFARTIIKSGSTVAGVISTSGGNGGFGSTGTVGNVGGGGGGAGGGGGFLYLVYHKLTGPVVTGLLSAAGGAGGNGGNGFGTGLGGNGGGSGAGGRVVVIGVNSNVCTMTYGSASVAGTAGSGITGGAGAAANAVSVNL